MDASWRPSRLPKSRQARARLAMSDTLEYVRLMGTEDEDKLMDSLAKLPGVTVDEQRVWLAEKYNVEYRFLPERLKDG